MLGLFFILTLICIAFWWRTIMSAIAIVAVYALVIWVEHPKVIPILVLAATILVGASLLQ